MRKISANDSVYPLVPERAYWRHRASEMKMYSFAFPSPALPTEGAGSQKPVFNALRSLAQGWIASHRVNALWSRNAPVYRSQFQIG